MSSNLRFAAACLLILLGLFGLYSVRDLLRDHLGVSGAIMVDLFDLPPDRPVFIQGQGRRNTPLGTTCDNPHWLWSVELEQDAPGFRAVVEQPRAPRAIPFFSEDPDDFQWEEAALAWHPGPQPDRNLLHTAEAQKRATSRVTHGAYSCLRIVRRAPPGPRFLVQACSSPNATGKQVGWAYAQLDTARSLVFGEIRFEGLSAACF